ncbi:MAG: aldo/keto reductase, partial [Actinomycetota bacterium]|nr:aldo/keto reductase [Actinomycetota bacterium]
RGPSRPTGAAARLHWQTRTVITRQVAGATVSGIGLGTMVFGFGDATNDEQSIRTLHTAFDAGIDLVDTALCYTSLDEPSHSERVVAEAIRTWGGDIRLATKGGHWRDASGFPKDGRPVAIRAHCETSLSTLGVESIWLYQLHWPDPAVPIEESMGAFAELQQEGKVQHVGVSNFSLDQLAAAQSVVTVASVQNPFSIVRQDDREVLDHCAASDIAYLAYSPVGGHASAKKLDELVPAISRVAEAHGVTPQTVALAWLLAQSSTVVPLAGSSRPETVLSSAAAGDLELTPEELALLG